jgi:hypothetical protein
MGGNSRRSYDQEGAGLNIKLPARTLSLHNFDQFLTGTDAKRAKMMFIIALSMRLQTVANVAL